MAKFYKMAKCVLSWPAQLRNGQIFRNWPWNYQSGNTAAMSRFCPGKTSPTFSSLTFSVEARFVT